MFACKFNGKGRSLTAFEVSKSFRRGGERKLKLFECEDFNDLNFKVEKLFIQHKKK